MKNSKKLFFLVILGSLSFQLASFADETDERGVASGGGGNDSGPRIVQRAIDPNYYWVDCRNGNVILIEISRDFFSVKTDLEKKLKDECSSAVINSLD